MAAVDEFLVFFFSVFDKPLYDQCGKVSSNPKSFAPSSNNHGYSLLDFKAFALLRDPILAINACKCVHSAGILWFLSSFM